MARHRESLDGATAARLSRCLTIGLLLLLAAALLPERVLAAAPAGPRLAIEVSRPYPQPDGIETVGPAGEAPKLLVGGGGEGAVHPNGDRPAWSPDGKLLAFTASFGEYSPVIYVTGAAGGRPRLVSKAGPLSDPIFSPNGRSLVFSALRVVKGEFQRPARRSDDDYGVVVDWAVVKVPVRGGQLRRLTPWRRRQALRPLSFSPDGTTLTAERESRAGVDAVAVGLGSGHVRLLARDAEEPVYSPDGSRVAFVRTTREAPGDPGLNPRPTSSTLFLMPAAGGPATELVRVKGGLAWPSWDPSGQRLAFTRLGGGTFGLGSHPHEGNSVMQVNADGTCLSQLLKIGRGTFYGSAWQPGPGREAGPIAC